MSEPLELTSRIWEAATRVGRNAPKIVDDLLSTVCPETASCAETEGVAVYLRRGLIEHVTRILKAANDDDGQTDMGDINPLFRSLAKVLKSKSYYVEGLGEQVSVSRLIADPELLNDARQYMRRKGVECLDEARRLDDLYAAVVEQAA